ncbi:hypothetical protein, partial [Tenacibaculum maritimum]|uniref:hypothetical protein n=1 Tax=Tenacibaculum maritimum TaxID=107401 RepID=UPI00387647A2
TLNNFFKKPPSFTIKSSCYTKEKLFQKKSKKYDNDIIIVKTQPVRKRYYEFQSYKKPKTVSSISDLKTYSIKDISKNIEIFKESWGNHKYSIVFIEKVNCNYKLWEMKRIYLE